MAEDSEEIFIGDASAPSRSRGDALDRLIFEHFVMKVLLYLPLVERLEVEIRCLLVDAVSLLVIQQVIVLVLI